MWAASDVGADPERLGLSGSPTKVLKVNYVVLGGTETKDVAASEEGVSSLIRELVDEYIL
mgnify:CR=1 FL=1